MSITTGIDAIIAARRGDLADPSDVGALFDAMVTHLTDRHRVAPRFATRGPSRENWRLEKRLTISPHNRSPEKTLEKKLAALLDDTWANMVPTASGLWDENADKQRNLDLVNRVEEGVYEFIELKIGSDTPQSAAVQLATYAALFVVARRLYTGHRPQMLAAHDVRLRVLAPAPFYAAQRLRPLRDGLDHGLREWAATHEPSLALSFEFNSFPSDFRWPGAQSDGDVLAAFNARSPLT